MAQERTLTQKQSDKNARAADASAAATAAAAAANAAATDTAGNVPLTDDEVEIAADVAWAASAGQEPKPRKPLTYGPNKQQPKKKKKRPSDYLKPREESAADSSAGAGAYGYGYGYDYDSSMYSYGLEPSAESIAAAAAANAAVYTPDANFKQVSINLQGNVDHLAQPRPSESDQLISELSPLADDDNISADAGAVETYQRLFGDDASSLSDKRQALVSDSASEDSSSDAKDVAAQLAASFAQVRQEAALVASESSQNEEGILEAPELTAEEQARIEAAAIAAAEAAAAEQREQEERAMQVASTLPLPVEALPPEIDRIGIVGGMTFPELRQNDLVYVNKVLPISEILNYGQVLLVRPRGFGMSMLLSTIECVLCGYKQYFAGLKDSSWLQNHLVHPMPIVHLDLGQFLIKITYDDEAAQAYINYKAAQSAYDSLALENTDEERYRAISESCEQSLEQIRKLLTRLRSIYHEIHNRLDELNRACAMEQGVLERTFRKQQHGIDPEEEAQREEQERERELNLLQESHAQDADVDAAADGKSGKGGKGDKDNKGSSVASANGVGEAKGNSAIRFPRLKEEIPSIAAQSLPIVIPPEARAVVDALSLCEAALRILQGQQQMLGLQVELYLAQEHYALTQVGLDAALEDDRNKKRQLKEVMLEEEDADEESVEHTLQELAASPELTKARERCSQAHQRLIAAEAQIEVMHEVMDSIDIKPLKWLQARVKASKDAENNAAVAAAAASAAAAATAVNKQNRKPKITELPIPEEVKPLMEEIALMSKLLRELHLEWGKRRIEFDRKVMELNDARSQLRRIARELEQARFTQRHTEAEEQISETKWRWEQERNRLVNELATAYYQQFYQALKHPTRPRQAEAVAAAYAKAHAKSTYADVPTDDDIAAHAADAVIAALNEVKEQHLENMAQQEAERVAKEQAQAAAAEAAVAAAEAAAATAAALASGEHSNEEIAAMQASTASQEEIEAAMVANTSVNLLSFEEQMRKLIFQHASKLAPCALMIDNYDAALTSIDDCPELKEPLEQLLAEMVTAIRANQSLFSHIFFMGSTDFSSNRAFVGFDRLVDISAVNNLATVVGLTEEELRDNYDIELISTAARIEYFRRIELGNAEYTYTVDDLIEEMKEHYGNYRFAQHSPYTLFRTREVMHFLQDFEEQHYFKHYL